MPAIGLGTFGSDHVPHAAVAAAVKDAASLGYRHFDCAAVYGNEDLIGESLQAVMRTGIKRDELWITRPDTHPDQPLHRTGSPAAPERAAAQAAANLDAAAG